MKAPEQIADEISAGRFGTYQDSAEEVGHPEGQPIVETWPALRECIVAAIEIDRRQRDESVHAAAVLALEEWIEIWPDEIDLNAARRRAVEWIESEPDEFWLDFAGPMLHDIEKKFLVNPDTKCDECDESAVNFWPDLMPPVQLCASCTHNARRSGWEPED